MKLSVLLQARARSLRSLFCVINHITLGTMSAMLIHASGCLAISRHTCIYLLSFGHEQQSDTHTCIQHYLATHYDGDSCQADLPAHAGENVGSIESLK